MQQLLSRSDRHPLHAQREQCGLRGRRRPQQQLGAGDNQLGSLGEQLRDRGLFVDADGHLFDRGGRVRGGWEYRCGPALLRSGQPGLSPAAGFTGDRRRRQSRGRADRYRGNIVDHHCPPWSGNRLLCRPTVIAVYRRLYGPHTDVDEATTQSQLYLTHQRHPGSKKEGGYGCRTG